MEPKVEGEEGGKWRMRPSLSFRIQADGVDVSNTLSSQHPKFHSISVPVSESVLPGLCKMRWKTSGEGRAVSLRGAGAGASHSDPPTSPTQNGYSWLGSRNPPKLRRACACLGSEGKPKEAGRLSLGPEEVGWG